MMIKNFDVVKEQLKELSGVINTFKSEAVQLRLVDLIFQAADATGAGPEPPGSDAAGSGVRKKRQPRGRGTRQPKDGQVKARAGRPGGKAMLDQLSNDGFFKKPKTIKQIVEHCEHNLALKYKQSDFSGPLGRLTREGTLKRTKNADKQYEYSQS